MGTRIASKDEGSPTGPPRVPLMGSGGPTNPADPLVDQVAEMFKLLGDPTRCRILFALLASPDLRVLDIAAVTQTTQTTVSAALRLLRTAGVVIGRREGRTVHYRVADDHVAKLLTVSWQHSSHLGMGFEGAGRHHDHLEIEHPDTDEPEYSGALSFTAGDQHQGAPGSPR